MKHRAAALLACALALPCLAAPPWIDTPATRAFRQRVIDLAVLYGDSSGLDTNGYLIRTLLLPQGAAPCPTVRVTITLSGEPVQVDDVPACPHR